MYVCLYISINKKSEKNEIKEAATTKIESGRDKDIHYYSERYSLFFCSRAVESIRKRASFNYCVILFHVALKNKHSTFLPRS